MALRRVTTFSRRNYGFERVIQNGLLENDNYYRFGLPMEPKFKLPSMDGRVDTKRTSEDPRERFQAKRQFLNSIFSLHSHVDPYRLVEKELKSITENITELIGSDHPVLLSVAKYFFDATGKRVRPTIILVLSQALVPLIASFKGDPRYLRLSQITEMIHTASLLHDDVIDNASTRRGIPSLNRAYGNKLAILGGDYLLARASVALARLKDLEVVEIMSTVIEHLVKGEVMQFKPKVTSDVFDNIDYYLTKSYYKTASLISGSCKCAAILLGADRKLVEVAEEYGKNIGLAFQVVDDLLDFSGTASNMGKPTLNDLNQGVATAPVLYAAQQFPELRPMIDRKFSEAGDLERAVECVHLSGSLDRAEELAVDCSERAIAAVLQLPPSKAQSAAIELVHRVLSRDR